MTTLQRVLRRAATRNSVLPIAGALLLVALSLVLAACGGAGGKVAHSGGASDLVLRSATGGGFVPVELNLSELPEFSLYGDGTVITEGPVIEIYPQPAMPNLQRAKVTQAGIQTLLVAARDAGLFAVRDYGTPGITDVATTVFTVKADKQEIVNKVYALGFEEVSGLSDEQVQARKKASGFSAKLSDLTATLGQEVGASTAYEPQALAVYARPAVPEDQQGEVAPSKLQWPLADLSAVPPGDAGFSRLVVQGSDLEKLRPLLSSATQITLWESAGKQYRLVFRPLLPDEVPTSG